MKIENFTKTVSPLSVIVNFVNPVGIKLAETLIEQGSRVILVDSFTSAKRKAIGDLLKNDRCVFMDIESTFKNLEKFKKIDYMYYFMHAQVGGSTFPDVKPGELDLVQLTHKDFSRETARVDAYIKLAIEFDAKFELITAGFLGQLIEMPNEQNIQLQKYAESLLHDYYNKTRFNGRIVRLGEVYGERTDLAVPTNFSRLAREMFFDNVINIYGEGLQNNYFVHYLDAVYGLLKVNFNEKTKGKTYLLADTNPVSTLSLAYRMLEVTPDEKEVIFNEVSPKQEEVFKLKDLCIAPNAQEAGWEPTMTFDSGIQETLEFVAGQFQKEWKPLQQGGVKTRTVSSAGATENEDLPKRGIKMKENAQVKKEIVWYRFDYLLYQAFNSLIRRPFQAVMKAPAHVAKATEQVTTVTTKNVIPWIITASIFIVITILLAPYVNLAVFSLRGYLSLRELQNSVASLNPEGTKQNAAELVQVTQGIKSSLQGVTYLRYFGGSMQYSYDQAVLLADASNYYGKSIHEMSLAAEPLMTYYKEFSLPQVNNPAGQGTRDYFTEISKIVETKVNIYRASQYAAIGGEMIVKVDANAFPGFMQSGLLDAKKMGAEYSTSLQTLTEMYEYLPFLLGYQQRTNYLVMVQNETEIRATGGWFTNYAIIGIENGRIRELTVDDVYNIDGQLVAKQAPAAMRDGLGIDSYKFSLSNWSPDVPATALDAESFLKQAGKASDIQVFVLMNFGTLRELLKVTGPITLAEYGEVSADNLFDKVVELHTSFTPGSQQKVGIVSSLVPELFNQITRLDASGKKQALDAMVKSISQRNMMVYSDNPAFTNSFLKKYNTFLQLDQLPQPSVFITDWNWSGNKTNKYVTRETNIEVNETRKQVRLTMTYRNTSRTENYPEGRYRNYQRVFFPKTWKLVEAAGYTEQMKVYEQSNAIYTGQMVEVPIQGTRSFALVFEYDEFPSVMNLVKQAGLESEQITVQLTLSRDSTLPEAFLLREGFAKNGNIFSKSFLRTSDASVRFAQ